MDLNFQASVDLTSILQKMQDIKESVCYKEGKKNLRMLDIPQDRWPNIYKAIARKKEVIALNWKRLRRKKQSNSMREPSL